MATINNTWSDSTPASSDNVGEGDDRIRETKAAVRERARNAGLYLPDASAAASSGVPFVSPDALVADEFNIFANNAGVPDTAKKLFKLKATTLDIHSDITLNAAGVLQQAGSVVLSKAGTKRTIVFSVGGFARATQPGDNQPLLQDRLMYMPQTNSGGGVLVGTIREFAVVMMSEPSANVTFDLQRVAVGASWASDQLPDISATTSLLASVLTVPTAGTFLGARHDDAADFAGAAFPTLAGGDVLRVIAASSPAQTIHTTAFVVVDFDWP